MSAHPVDVLAKLDAAIAVVEFSGADRAPPRNAAGLRAARDAVAELIAACRARDAFGMRPAAIEIAVDCSGYLSEEAARYDAVQARYRVALVRCGGAS